MFNRSPFKLSSLNKLRPSQKLRVFYIAVVFSYLPPALVFGLAGWGVYQQTHHILLVLLASGVATGRAVRSPRLRLFLALSMGFNLIVLGLTWINLNISSNFILAAMSLLVLSAFLYYLHWGWDLLKKLIGYD